MAVIGFSPHAYNAGVFAKIAHFHTVYPNFWSFKEVFSATKKAIRLYGFIALT